MIANGKIRVLVVDDSALMRKAISGALTRDPQIEVVGTAADPYEARDKILALAPDVLTLDIQMPRMDGLTFLKILQQHQPTPVIVISVLSTAGSQATLAALEAGAVDVLAKPDSRAQFPVFAEQLVLRVKGAAAAHCHPGQLPVAARPLSPLVSPSAYYDPRRLIVIGASTGGTQALSEVLSQLPDPLPGICIVQHIPAYFSKTFADRLNELCTLEVREAADGDDLRPGLALVAPGDFHMTVSWVGDRYRVALNQQPQVHYCRPSVDVLFQSVLQCRRARVLAIVLTGMGRDGAQGMQQLRAAGASTVAQDEETSVVYGMPRAAAELGAVEQVLPLHEIPQAIVQWSSGVD
jgi:two-component system, chemotaxis family, protein-glutamate methylesterase/glutaminase